MDRLQILTLAITVVSVLACGLAMFALVFMAKTNGKVREAFH
jgi:Tfp pilus assembly protein PilN